MPKWPDDDVILFELVYTGPLGYWHEITCLYSFGPLPDARGHGFAKDALNSFLVFRVNLSKGIGADQSRWIA